MMMMMNGSSEAMIGLIAYSTVQHTTTGQHSYAKCTFLASQRQILTQET